MATLFRRLTGAQPAERGLFIDQVLDSFGYNGTSYPFIVPGGNQAQRNEEPGGSYQGYVEGIYKRNGVVFACMAARQLLFSEARFQYQRMRNGRPGDLYGTQALSLLERPWQNGTTGDLLSRAIVDVDLAGNFYAVRRGNAIRRLRPDWVTIIAGTRTGSMIDAEVIGYEYREGGYAGTEDPVMLLPEFVCHFKAYDDPTCRFRGLSWLTPVLGDIVGDSAATQHKSNFFDQGATLGYVVTVDPNNEWNDQRLKLWKDKFRVGHEGAENAYKTLFLTGGADIKVVGTNLKDVDFKAVQGAGETRICAAARVPPIIVGVSEGLESATYSNYGQARRAFADLTMRPLWRQIAGALESIVDVPSDSRLWYDDRDIPFLQEDLKDTAEIQSSQAATIGSLIQNGFTPESAIAAVQNDEWSLLVHTGLVSVQLQPPGQSAQPSGPSIDGTAEDTGAQQALPPGT